MTNEQKMNQIEKRYHVVGVKKIAYGTLVTLENGAKVTLYDKGTHRVQNDLEGGDSVKKWLDNGMQEGVTMTNPYYKEEMDCQGDDEDTPEITKLYVLDKLRNKAQNELMEITKSKSTLLENTNGIQELIALIEVVSGIIERETVELLTEEEIEKSIIPSFSSDSYMSTIELVESLEKRPGVTYAGVPSGEYVRDVIDGLELEGPATVLIIKD